MQYDAELMRIGRIANGYIVECHEPKKRKPSKDGMVAPGGSDWCEYAFVDKPGKPAIGEVLAFIEKKLPTLERTMAEEYNKAFDEAAEEDDD